MAPLKKKRAQDAIAAAYERIGVTPNKDGRNIHGLRHWAKFYAENELGLNPRQIQIIRGDRSIASQEHYGRDAKHIYKRVQEAQIKALFNEVDYAGL